VNHRALMCRLATAFPCASGPVPVEASATADEIAAEIVAAKAKASRSLQRRLQAAPRSSAHLAERRRLA
jgi:hypothetical protein